tara:strand:- start:7974 stop:8651 length:678 start_codon:yes stop_codon:yes gene_type:complete
MKKHIIGSLIILLFTNTLFSQTDCSKYYPFKAGVKSEITIYNKKDTKEAVVNYIVKEITTNKATITSEVYDKKGEFVLNSEYDVLCNGDGISIDFKSMVDNQMLEQYKDMELEMTGTNIDLPNNLTIGETLPDATMDMVVSAGPIKMKMFVKMINRYVEGKEKITTPAGSFDCIIITYDTELKMGMKKTFKHKQWLAEGVGMVKSEDYNKSGNLTNKSILTKFDN